MQAVRRADRQAPVTLRRMVVHCPPTGTWKDKFWGGRGGVVWV